MKNQQLLHSCGAPHFACWSPSAVAQQTAECSTAPRKKHAATQTAAYACNNCSSVQ